jgi:hypothetical protein
MRKIYDTIQVSDLCYEMVIYAWSRNKLQKFTSGTLFGEVSQAFYN